MESSGSSSSSSSNQHNKNRKRKERRRRQAQMAAEGSTTLNMFDALRTHDAEEEESAESHAPGNRAGDGAGDGGARTKQDSGAAAAAKKKRGRDGDYRSVVEDNRKRIEQFAAADKTKTKELVLGGDLGTLEKRLLAGIARHRFGLAVQEECGPKRTVRISKPLDWAEQQQARSDEERRARRARGGRQAPLTATTMPVPLRHRFAVDFSLPMPVLESPYFEYFLNLYEPLMQSRSNFDLFLEAVNSQGGASKWRNYTGELVQRIIDDVTGTPAYKAFAADDLSRFDVADTDAEKDASENLYRVDNSGKYFISLDFTSANFNSLRYYDPDIVHGTKNWVEFLSRYTSYQALLNSKRFRAAVMGKINHRAQIKIYNSLIQRIYRVLLDSGVVDASQVVCKYTDEIVMQTTKKGYRALIPKLRRILEEEVSDIDFIKLEPFRLVRLGPPTEENKTEMCVKEILTITDDETQSSSPDLKLPPGVVNVVFKCVYSRKFAQVYKHYFRMEINEMDRTYVDYDGRFHIMPTDELWHQWSV